ncbi:hypothetical protein [Kocuria marina]|uniref:hypothetical protein n=1 Tax=Kocuria marina TaxID=223184 RepID=UPI0022E08F66|nr:hypothetical protein [Kocuria marina]
MLSAFRSDPAMPRQGTVTIMEEAEEYVRRLTDPDGPRLTMSPMASRAKEPTRT